MKAMFLIGCVLVVAGIVALAYGGITYTTKEEIIDIGPFNATTEKTNTVPLSPLFGGLSLLGGIALLVAGGRKG